MNKRDGLIDRQYSNTSFSELFKNFCLVFTLRVSAAGLAFFFTLYLARLLKEEDYGLFMLSLTIVTIFSVVNRLGLENVLVRFFFVADAFRNNF